MAAPALVKEKYYTEPPFDYRPSLAEYLTRFKVSVNGIVADILHLEKKGNLEIKNYFEKGVEIALRNKKDLNDNEIFLWNYLEKQKKNGIVKINFGDLKKIERGYEKQVIGNSTHKFGTKLGFNPANTFGGFVIFGFLVSIALSIVTQFLSFPALIIMTVATLPMASAGYQNPLA
ncbi:MAG: DUF2207 domain-containing protein, partial [Candidatus Diapherotrites archaeon]|nr:DUF2207 domain-containing protein [Candidatus Diapherotrites archaeon]